MVGLDLFIWGFLAPILRMGLSAEGTEGGLSYDVDLALIDLPGVANNNVKSVAMSGECVLVKQSREILTK